MNRRTLHTLILAALSTQALAIDDHVWYLSASAGIFQGTFNTQYNDQTDALAQNFRQGISQNSYRGGLALGYSKRLQNTYFVGGELGINAAGYHANFATGAATAAFTDTLAVNGNIDLTFVPGLMITDTVAIYTKAGLSVARITADIHSPIDFQPVYTNTSNITTKLGAALGLGLEKVIANNTTLFVEYDYHDYGTVNFTSFQNFTATYSHFAHVYTQSLSIGAAYLF